MLHVCFAGLVTLATTKIRVLETELSRAAAERDLLRKVALSAEARQHSEEDRAIELERKREVRIIRAFLPDRCKKETVRT